MNRNFLYSLLFVLSGSSWLVSQNPDSLKLALKQATHDTTRCAILSQLAETASDEEWPGFNKQLKELAEKKLSTAPASLKKTYLRHLANALHNTAYIYETEGRVDEALEFYLRSLKMQEEVGNKEGVAYAYNDIGVIYDRKGDVQTALDYYNQSLKVREEIGKKEGMGHTLNNLGALYNNIGQSHEAIACFKRALEVQEEIGDRYGLATSLSNIGFMYIKQKQWKEALHYAEQGLKVREEVSDEPGMSGSLSNLGVIYDMLGDTKKGLQYYERSLKIREKYNDRKGMAEALSNIGKNYSDQGDLVKGLNYAVKGFAIAKELGYPESVQLSAKVLSVIYEKQNKGELALQMYKLHVQMEDSVKNIRNQKVAYRKEAQYKYEKQRAKDSVVTAQNLEVKNLQIENQKSEIGAKKTQQYYLFGGLGLVMAFAGFMYNRFKITQKQKEVIEEQKAVVETQKHVVEEKQKEILDSINYAKRIQTALLPNEKYIERKLKENMKA